MIETGLPRVVSASGSSLGVVGKTRCKLQLNHKVIEQEFLVCEYLKRHLILGIDFARTNKAGVQWTKEGTRVLTIGVCQDHVYELHKICRSLSQTEWDPVELIFAYIRDDKSCPGFGTL